MQYGMHMGHQHGCGLLIGRVWLWVAYGPQHDYRLPTGHNMAAGCLWVTAWLWVAYGSQHDYGLSMYHRWWAGKWRSAEPPVTYTAGTGESGTGITAPSEPLRTCTASSSNIDLHHYTTSNISPTCSTANLYHLPTNSPQHPNHHHHLLYLAPNQHHGTSNTQNYWVL